MSKILSGKVKKVSPSNVSADRYNFLQLSEAEPDLGVPALSGYALTSAADGTRSWTDLSALYVSVDGDTINGDLTINGDIVNVDSISFDLTAAITVGTGQMAWNADEETLDLGLVNGTVLQLGQEVHYHVQNQSGSDIGNGALVVASGTTGNSGKLLIEEWDPATYPAVTIMGIATSAIDNGETGYVTHFGKVRGIQTNGGNYSEVWLDGDILYAGPSGGLTKFVPEAPNSKTIIAIVVSSHPSNGTLFVRPTLSSSIANDDLVQLSALSDNQLLYYNAANERFENTSTLETLTVDNVNIDGSNISGVSGTTIYLKNLGEPTLSSDAATKSYVDTIASASLHYHDPVRVESPIALTASYNNGSSGVGATLTNTGTLAAIVIDGVALSLNDRVLVYNQSNAAHNGVYYVSNVGSGSVAWVLTRTLDADSYSPSDPSSLGTGDAFYVKEGDTGAGELYVMTTPGTITFGTTEIVFSQISSAQIYSAGAGLELNGTVFSHTDTSSAANLTATSRTYVTGLAFDTFGHVTGYSTGTETVVNTDTKYSISTEVGDNVYSKKIRLEGTDATSDDIVIAVGAVDTVYGLTISETGDTITLAHADTSSVSNLSSDNANGIVIQDLSLSFDTYGHVTGATVATIDLDARYDNYSSWTAEDGDGTIYTVTSGDTLKFAEGTGIDVNFTADDVLTFTNTDLGSSQNIFKNFVISDTDSGYTWSDTGTINAGSNNDTITLVSGTNVEIDTDPTSKAIRITATVSGDDNYVDSVAFDTGTGILTLGRTGTLADLTVDLDGRYAATGSNTTYTLDGSGTTNDVNIELIGSDASTDSINVVGAGGTTVAWDEGNQRITITSTDANTDNYVDSASFNTGDGILTLGRTGGLSDVTVDLDGRYLTTDSDTTYTLDGSGTTNSVNIELVAGGSGSGTDTINVVGAGGTTVAWDEGNQRITITSTDLNTDNYVDSVAFDTGTGVLTLGRTGALADLTVDLDGRYDNYVSWTAQDGDTTTYTVTSGDTLQFAQGAGISVNFTADDVLTFTNTDLGSSQNIFKTITVDDTDTEYGWSDVGSVVADSNNDTLTIVSGDDIDVDVDATNDAIRIAHRDVARSDTTSSTSPGYGGTFTVVDSITSSARGHVTAVNLKTVTMPSVDDTNTTYSISAVDSDDYSKKIRLSGSDASTDDVTLAVGAVGTTYGLAIERSTDTITFKHADTSTQTSVNNSNGNVIQDITLDEYGHLTGIGSVDLDSRYVNVTGDTMTGNMIMHAGSNASYTSGIKFRNDGYAHYSIGSKGSAFVISDTGTDGTAVWPTVVNDRLVLTSTTLTYNGNTVWHSGNDGVSSELDADLLDGEHGSYYLDWTNVTNKPDPVVTLSGDVSGTATMTNLGSINITTTVADDSHNHIIDNVDGLQDALNLKAPLASPALTGTPTAPTAAAATNTTQIATTAFVQTAVANLVDTAPTTLDTLNELAAALGDDPNFATTVTNAIAAKVSKSGDTMTGALTIDGTNVDTAPILNLQSGNAFDAFNNGAQIRFGYNDTNNYAHFIHTRHNSSNANNAIDFYVSDGTDSNSITSGSVHTMSLVSGSVGIGTTSPAYKLHTIGTAAFANNGNENLFLIDTATVSRSSLQISGAVNYFNANIDSASHGQFIWRSSNAYNERMRIDASGNVGIGTSAPQRKLHVQSAGEVARFQSTTSSVEVKFYSTAADYSAIGHTGDLYFAVGGAERMRINSSGNVGIGTSTPSFPLDVVANSSSNAIQLRGRSADNTSRIELKSNDAATLYGGIFSYNNVLGLEASQASGNILFRTNSTERLRIDSSGNVGIGTSSPLTLLQVGSFTSTAPSVDGNLKLLLAGGSFTGAGLISSSVSFIHFGDYDNSSVGKIDYNHTSDSMIFFANAGERMRITSAGNVGIGTSSPARRLQVQGGDFYTSERSDTIGGQVGYGGSSFQIRNGLTSEDLNFDIYNRSSPGWYTAMIIKNTGNVGIGITSPTARLHIEADSSGNNFKASRGSGSLLESFQSGNGANYLYTSGSSAALVFGTGTTVGSATERVRITSSGNVGIGTSSPVSKLDVAGTLTISNGGALSMPESSVITAYSTSPIDTTSYVFAQKIYPTISYNGTDFTSGDSIVGIEQSITLSPNNDLASGTLYAYGLFSAVSTPVTSTGTFATNDIRAVYGNVYHYNNSNLIRMVGVAGRTYNRGTGTVGSAYSFWARNNTNTGGGSITQSHGLYIDNIANGVSNYGITSLVSAGTNKWNIYASGTANNYFAGNVGIGTNAPASALHVNTSANEIQRLQTSGASGGYATFSNGSIIPLFIGFGSTLATGTSINNGVIRYDANNNLLIARGGTEIARFDSNSNFGIGTSAPSAKLEVSDSSAPEIRISNGGGTSPAPRLVFYRQSGVSATIRYDTANKNLQFDNEFAGSFEFYSGGSKRLELNTDGDLIPSISTQDLGSVANPWQNIYTQDLVLSNESRAEGNSVDGTTGNWTVQEGEEHLYIINNKTGKKYRFALEEIE